MKANDSSGESPSQKATYVFSRAILSMVLLWLSFPPTGLSFLAWFSLIPLLHIVADSKELSRLNYCQVYIAGLFYWLATFYFIPIPHPALWIGWIVISAYLACYFPIFVSSTRTMNLALKIPLVLAAAISWTGLELIRNYLFTGMGLVSLAHSQFRQPLVLQICDLSGGYTLTFSIVMFSTSLLACVLQFRKRPRFAVSNAIVGILVILGVVAYGKHQLNQTTNPGSEKLLVGLIQGSMDTNLMSTPEEYEKFQTEKTIQYQQLNSTAIQKWDRVDLVVWPENGWPYPDLHPDTDTTQMHSDSISQFEYAHLDAFAKLFVAGKQTPFFLVGAVTYDPVRRDSYGSALFIDDQGVVKNRYYKNHLVMFGEYVPLAKWFPMLQRIPAIGKGLVAGTESISVGVNGFRLTPSICFESTVPHYVRSQLNQLAAADLEADVMVNMTNDGWFYGTSCLDFHLACNVFRAVEMRKPHLVCANTGLSAHIDDQGRIVQEGPRRDTATLLARVFKSNQSSVYRTIGDVVPMTFAMLTIAAFICGYFVDPLRADQQSLNDSAGKLT